MRFFVPATSDDEFEKRYAELAEFANVPAPPLATRLLTIQWEHNGEVWEATVGERLVRIAPRPKMYDNPVVLAIFPGTPYLVVTAAQPLVEISSDWHNPISAGVPPQIKKQVLFDSE